MYFLEWGQSNLFLIWCPPGWIRSDGQNIKQDSSKWINRKKFTREKFEWQEARLNDAVGQGYGAFSYSKSQASRVIGYVQNQENHHRKITFLDEYRKFLEKFEIGYDERYIFKAPE